MALYTKQDFSPPILSRKWIAMKFRPNMLIYGHQHIISILESGLLFREDSIEVEQEAPCPEEVWAAAGGRRGGWFTRGEKIASVCTVAACVLVFPPRNIQRSTLLRLAAYMTLPVALRTAHRASCRGTLLPLLSVMRDYLALARRAAACLKECAALRAELDSVTSVLESTHTMLCRQQSSLAVVMSRASSALLGNAPWLRADVAWAAVSAAEENHLQKIHHAFLVVQSTLLKHIAMAHYIPPTHAQKIYKNHNERLYWIHSVLIPHLTEDFVKSFESLERMYRLLKNYGNNEVNVNKKPGAALRDSWVYSDVHSGVARANLELKLALNKCNNLDTFLDCCSMNDQEIDLGVLNRDVDNLIETITKCLSTMQASQMRLKKLQNKLKPVDKGVATDNEYVENDIDEVIFKIDDREPETKDEVFYFVKTEDDGVPVQSAADITTGPGKKEKEATKIVLNELKRKLVRREDVMRERERQALAKTMPELKNELPEFERQNKMEENVDRKGYINKIARRPRKRRPHMRYKINSQRSSRKANKYRIKSNKYANESDIKSILYEANSNLNTKSKLLTFSKLNKYILITKWIRQVQLAKDLDSSGLSEGLSDVEAGTANKTVNQAVNINHRPDNDLDSSGLSEGLSDVEAGTANKTVNQAVNTNHRPDNGDDAANYRFTKKDLELTPSSSDDSDFEFFEQRRSEMLKDMRRNRAQRRKNYPNNVKRASPEDQADEGLRPMQYSVGAGLALAAVLRGAAAARGREDQFHGHGELSSDSGHEETVD